MSQSEHYQIVDIDTRICSNYQHEKSTLDMTQTYKAPIVSTHYLPRICGFSSCLKDAVKGQNFCKAHLKETRRLLKDTRDIEVPGCWIYFVQAGEDGPIKIGMSECDVKKRLSSMQAGNHNKLKLLAKVWKNPSMEVQLHGHFEKHNISGEWFEPCDELMSMVKCAKEDDWDGIYLILRKGFTIDHE